MNKIAAAALALLVSFSATAAGWSYSEDTDKMTGKTERFAGIESKNSLALRFPYQGTNKGRLWLRQHPTHGLDVFLEIDKGQILCSIHSGCPINVKFDDGAPVKFSGLESADHSRTTVFFQNERGFVSRAEKAKRILVQVNVYQGGAPVLEFEATEPLKWNKAAPGKKSP